MDYFWLDNFLEYVGDDKEVTDAYYKIAHLYLNLMKERVAGLYPDDNDYFWILLGL